MRLFTLAYLGDIEGGRRGWVGGEIGNKKNQNSDWKRRGLGVWMGQTGGSKARPRRLRRSRCDLGQTMAEREDATVVLQELWLRAIHIVYRPVKRTSLSAGAVRSAAPGSKFTGLNFGNRQSRSALLYEYEWSLFTFFLFALSGTIDNSAKLFRNLRLIV